MAKSRSLDEDKQILRRKVREQEAGSENPEGNEAIRSLRKRLKRVQRKLRSLKTREPMPASKQQEAEA